MPFGAEPVRRRRVGQRHFGDIHRLYRTSLVKFRDPIQMAWVPRHDRALYGHVIWRAEVSRWCRDICEAAAGFQNRKALFMYFTADRIKDDIARRNSLREILAGVIDNFIGTQVTYIVMVAGAGGRIDGRAKMLSILHRKSANTAGAGMDKDGFTRSKPNRIQRNHGRCPHKRQRGSVHMGQAGGLARDKRCIDGDRFGISPLLGLWYYTKYLVSNPEFRDTVIGRPYHTRKIDTWCIRKSQLKIVLARSVPDFPIHRLKYAHEATTLSKQERGSGSIRPICQEADAHLCLGNPIRAWDLYTEAVAQTSSHPLPRYYRGQALVLLARLLHAFEDEKRISGSFDADEADHISVVRSTILRGAMEDLTSAADLLDGWELIPESYQNRNFHMVATLLGQGTGYLLSGSPGPAASRLQSARRAFPKDDVFFREFLFAKCWEQGLHRHYGNLLSGDGWIPFRERLHSAFGEPFGWSDANGVS